MPADATVVVMGCVSAFPHGRHQLATLRAEAARRGVRVVGADSRERLAGADRTLADLETVAVPLGDPAACARELARVSPDAVLAYREAYVLPTARVASALGLAGNDPAAVELVRHKDRMRHLLATHGLPQPRVHLVATVDDAARHVDFEAAPRWVVKPRDGSGSEGVAAVSGPAELAAACRPLEGRGPFIVEEFVEGPELSAEGVFVGGEPHVLALTAKRVNEAFVELGHRMPASLPAEQEAAARDAVVAALQLSGLRHGIFHVELWLTATGVVLGEAHVRPGGDYLHLLVAASRPGIELYGLLMDDLLAVETHLGEIPAATRFSGIDFLELPAGTVSHVGDVDAVRSLDGVLVADVPVSVGDVVGPVTESGDRQGCLAVAADSPGAVEDRLAHARTLLAIAVQP